VLPTLPGSEKKQIKVAAAIWQNLSAACLAQYRIPIGFCDAAPSTDFGKALKIRRGHDPLDPAYEKERGKRNDSKCVKYYTSLPPLRFCHFSHDSVFSNSITILSLQRIFMVPTGTRSVTF